MMDRRLPAIFCVFAALVPMTSTVGAGGSAPEEVARLDIGAVWSGHPVGFFLLTQGRTQYVAFYDHQRRMTVARRDLSDRRWEFKRLDSVLGWDSHNYVTMAMDSEGRLHLSGNMHASPLVYFRADRPGDIQSLRRVAAMVGSLEKRCTYPRFISGPNGQLVFTYRDGGSGKGNQIYNACVCWIDRCWTAGVL